MEFKNLLTSDENRAVSPVIGVILMVAITVILAAVIGTFVLGLGDQVQETSPNTQWSWDVSGDTNDETLELTHEGGDSVNPEQLQVTGGDNINTDNDCSETDDWTGLSSNSRVTAGATCGNILQATSNAGGEYRLVWSSDGGGQSSTLSRFDADA